MIAIVKSGIYAVLALGCLIMAGITGELTWLFPLIIMCYGSTIFYIDHKFEELSDD